MTAGQKKIYRLILEHFAEFGCAPTLRGLMTSAGFTSPNGVVGHLKAIAGAGLIVWNRDGTSRGIEVPGIHAAAKATAAEMLKAAT
jgi:SOS-response transcriptional repressor LexA